MLTATEWGLTETNSRIYGLKRMERPASSPNLNPHWTLVGSALVCCSCQNDQRNTMADLFLFKFSVHFSSSDSVCTDFITVTFFMLISYRANEHVIFFLTLLSCVHLLCLLVLLTLCAHLEECFFIFHALHLWPHAGHFLCPCLKPHLLQLD